MADDIQAKYATKDLIGDVAMTYSLASWLIALVPLKNIRISETQAIIEAIKISVQQPLPKASLPDVERRDKRDSIETSIDKDGFVPKIYSDYEFGRNAIQSSTAYPVVDDINEADFIFTHLRVTNFYDIPQYLRVNQFPYEGSLVRKVSVLRSFQTNPTH
jgi:hypothetical protein